MVVLGEAHQTWLSEVTVGLSVLVLVSLIHVIGAWGRGRERG